MMELDQPMPASHSTLSTPLVRRLGIFCRVTIAGGSVLVLGILGFLAFLWTGEGLDSGNNASSAWRWIVLGQRLTQAITLSTVVLRIVIAAQESVVTSLVAALVLERHGVPLFRTAEVSLLRSANDGPLRLTWLLLSSGPNSAVVPKVAMTLLLVGFVAVQFSSTILVSDLSYGSLVGGQVNTVMGTGMKTQTAIQSGYPNVFAYSPVPIPFGEIQLSPGLEGVSDTGLIQRVFPPFSPETVTSLHDYRGGAIGMNSRYICIPPSINQLRARAGPGIGTMAIWMVGEISFNTSFAEAGLDFPADCAEGSCFAQAADFNCSLPFFLDDWVTSGPTAAFCLPHGVNALEFPDSFSTADGPISNYSNVFLISRNNSTFSTWNQTITATNGTGWLPFPSQGSRSNEWVSYTLENGCHTELSLCFQQLEYETYDVQMSSNTDLTVPSLVWDPATYEWDTTALENQYGILNSSATASQRGLFTVASIANGNKSDMAWYMIEELVTLIYSEPQPNNVTLFASPAAQGMVTTVMDDRVNAVFDRVLQRTDSPALALQSLLTAFTGSTLSNVVALFDDMHNVTIQSSASVLAPHQARGFIAVLAVVVSLLVTNITVVGLYLATTRYSSRGDYWCAVAQIVSDETRDILEWAPLRTDSEVRNLLTAEGRNVKMRIG